MLLDVGDAAVRVDVDAEELVEVRRAVSVRVEREVVEVPLGRHDRIEDGRRHRVAETDAEREGGRFARYLGEVERRAVRAGEMHTRVVDVKMPVDRGGGAVRHVPVRAVVERIDEVGRPVAWPEAVPIDFEAIDAEVEDGVERPGRSSDQDERDREHETAQPLHAHGERTLQDRHPGFCPHASTPATPDCKTARPNRLRRRAGRGFRRERRRRGARRGRRA
jgi:hypothetical protein